MKTRALTIVLTTVLVISILLMGMSYSFMAGGMDIALKCDTVRGFYHNGKLYVCVPRKVKIIPKQSVPDTKMIF
jgi:hypothetical protein